MLAAIVSLTFASVATAGETDRQVSGVIPEPSSWLAESGSWRVPNKITVQAGPGESQTAAVLAAWLGDGTSVNSDSGQIRLQILPDRARPKESEAYELQVSSKGILVQASSAAGLHNGAMSAAQMVLLARQPWADSTVGFGQMTDDPAFRWRGMHLDVSRHFFTVDQVKQYIDYLSFYKFNTFHWHLIDDGGWRLEIKKYPLLTQIGAFRASIPSWNQGQLRFPPANSGEKRYGGLYSQADVRHIVQYAKKRNVTVVPEIELPGHTMPSIAAYPNLACRGYSAKGFREASGNLSANVYCAGKEETFEFLQNVLDEVCSLFPSETIHIGGDEVNKYLWANCPDCKARMAKLGLKSTDELQSYFIKRIENYLSGKGRRIMGWDEILEGGLAPRAAVMSWRGTAGGIEAAEAGHEVVMSPTDPCYFDYTYLDNSVAKVYHFNPIPPTLPAEKHKFILGGQANVWTEWMPRFSRVQEMIFPRMIAMSEALWTRPDSKDFKRFEGKIRDHFALVDSWGVEQMLPAPEPSVSMVLEGVQQTPIDVAAAPYRGLTLRAVQGGGNPTSNSPAFRGPIRLSTGDSIAMAYFDRRGKRGPIRTVNSVAPVPVRGSLSPGVRMEVYEGTWRRVPQFSELKRASTHYVGAITPNHMKGKDNYALRFTGVIRIPTSGIYTMWLGSDDGSWLKIAGAKFIDNDDLHGFIWASGSVFLPAGLYPLEVGFFEQGGNDDVQVEIAGPNTSRRPIPSEWLLREH